MPIRPCGENAQDPEAVDVNEDVTGTGLHRIANAAIEKIQLMISKARETAMAT